MVVPNDAGDIAPYPKKALICMRCGELVAPKDNDDPYRHDECR